MLSKGKIKLVSSLQKKKYRLYHGLFVAEGHKLVAEIIKSNYKIRTLIATRQWLSKGIGNQWLSGFINEPIAEEIIESTTEEIQRLSGLQAQSSVIALVEIPKSITYSDSIRNDLSLVLDDIQDPGNFGTIIRTADWFGIKNIFCSPNTVDIYNAKVVQATMGSITRIRVHYTNLSSLLDDFSNQKDFKIYGTFLEGENIYEKSLNSKGFVVMGNEGKGISDAVKNKITDRLYIPTFQTQKKAPESLNVATATSIICSEFRRGGL